MSDRYRHSHGIGIVTVFAADGTVVGHRVRIINQIHIERHSCLASEKPQVRIPLQIGDDKSVAMLLGLIGVEQITTLLHKPMSWERRGSQVYYFRALRQDGRIVKQYFGRGPEAAVAAEEDASRRTQQAALRQAHQQQRSEFDAVADRIAVLGNESDAMVAAALLAAGFHRPQRKPWRKRRATTKET